MWTSIIPWEDVGIVLGQLFAQALGGSQGDQSGGGYFVVCRWMRRWRWVAVDLGGRPALVYKDRVKVRAGRPILQTELVGGFLRRIRESRGEANLHAKVSVRKVQSS